VTRSNVRWYSEFQVCVAATENACRANKFVFLQQTAAGRQKTAEAEQEQVAGLGRSGMLPLMKKAP